MEGEHVREAPGGIAGRDLADIDNYLRERTQEGLFSGVVRLDRNDASGTPGQSTVLLRRAYGWASRTWETPCEVTTRFDTASTTKLFTAVAALQQVEAGAFALDTSVTGYLGLGGTPISPDVTPHHLLTHSSGIGDDADEDAGEVYEALFVDRPNYAIRATADFLPQFIEKAPNFAPGEGCRYCNVGYVLLGLMVERATGRSYRDYVADSVFKRARMTHSGFASMDIVTAGIAEGADPVVDESGQVVAWRRNIYSFPPVGSPDSGAQVTADDLFRFHQALVGGELLGPTLTAAMLAPHVRYRPRGAGFHMTGFGFEFETNAEGKVRSYWKEGHNVGVSAALCHYPSTGITLAMLSNMQDGVWQPIKKIETALGL